MKPDQSEKFERAQKRVKDLKDFYRHLRVYIVINLILVFLIYRGLDFFGERAVEDSGFNDWLVWNIFGTPIIWGIGLGFHAVYVFVIKSRSLKELKPKFYKEWEERQIEKYMNEESNLKD